MRVGFMIVVVVVLLVLALESLEAIASRRQPIATPLPKSPASATWGGK